MLPVKPFLATIAALLTTCLAIGQSGLKSDQEPFRPLLHFTPQAHWINDPNGMVYHDGTYHLFFQYYPDGTKWGPMHWGHATSTDLLQWREHPIALYPDSLGYIFSGSAVVDAQNTSGFGKDGQLPLVAIFTHHDPTGEKNHTGKFQHQSLAYSIDNGNTWIKYAGNPVIPNPGIIDFRDPKVSWHEPTKQWIMTLATKDRITFYSSPNLKEWTKESEFGEKLGAHGGVWECPDLFTLTQAGVQKWILIVNINPGGPNGGSATQYFIGQFDGHQFTPDDEQTRWLDYGPDEYAGVIFSNTGKRRIFMGWMSNWDYADRVPTATWRGAMTLPRDLQLVKTSDGYRVASLPSPEVNKRAKLLTERRNVDMHLDKVPFVTPPNTPYAITLRGARLQEFSVRLFNDAGEELIVGYDQQKGQWYIDRGKAGQKDFANGFARRHVAARFTNSPQWDLRLIIDKTSIELFADGGLTTMTSIFFPTTLLNKSQLLATGPVKADITQVHTFSPD
ncbi:glycoside hydrolase family 32 protein [Paraflavitalea sp. CAU 1676]|uniref:glycoside hydrolase family 32 protein n=1 Tax=Paraflavitalea sp. CAU 1676 TaxID=3032598 RepID=UPI0023DBE8DE|nr:glycoside hydrolase family 32 protein [Paraflavitalea sp. CAU 1676]MDF2190570.1 glycoside hydrolase family 32 protein [Paraflavitalea sp. CAU 1676]